jgi:hypothetical protein
VNVETHEIHRSWVAVLVAAGLAYVLLSQVDLEAVTSWLEGWRLAVTLVALSSACFWIFDRRPTVIVDQHGFCDRRTGVDPVPWSQIERAERCGVREIRLVLNQPLEQTPKNAVFGKLSSKTELVTNAWGLRIGYEELVELLQGILLERVLEE